MSLDASNYNVFRNNLAENVDVWKMFADRFFTPDMQHLRESLFRELRYGYDIPCLLGCKRNKPPKRRIEEDAIVRLQFWIGLVEKFNRGSIHLATPVRWSDIYTIPKNKSIKIREIWNGSTGYDSDFGLDSDLSINGGVPEMFSKTYLTSMKQMKLAVKKYPNGWIWSQDLSACYENFSLTMPASLLCGFKVEGINFIHTKLPFGLSMSVFQCGWISSVALFFAKMLDQVVHPVSLFSNEPLLTDICSYVDDYTGFAHSYVEAWTGMWLFIFVFEWLGFTLNKKKAQPPAQKMKVLGIDIDMKYPQFFSLPEDKVIEARERIQECLDRKWVTLKSARKLGDYLQHVSCTMVVFGPFIDSLWRAVRSCHNKIKRKEVDRRFHLDKRFVLDLKWYLDRLNEGPRRCLNPELTTLTTWTDASSKVGFGGFDSHGRYFAGVWTQYPELMNLGAHVLHINLMELLTATAFVCVLSSGSQGDNSVALDFQMFCWCDNKSAVSWLNKGRGRNPIVINWMRYMTWELHDTGLVVASAFLDSESNYCADDFSRDEVQLALDCTRLGCQCGSTSRPLGSTWTTCKVKC